MDVKERIEAFRVLRAVAVSAASVGSQNALLKVMECIRTLIATDDTDDTRLFNVIFRLLPTRYSDYGDRYVEYNKIQAIKLLRELSATHNQPMGLRDAKESVERYGAILLSGLTKKKAVEAVQKFDDLDVKVDVVEA